MNYLITGCAGFIGAAVSEALLCQSHHVVGMDDLNGYYSPALKHHRLAKLKPYQHFDFHRVDIRVSASLRPILRKQKFDAVLHFAAQPGVRISVVNPSLSFSINATGTLTMLEMCREYGIDRFLLASTSSVYGDPFSDKEYVKIRRKLHDVLGAGFEQTFKEDSITDMPISPYAASKKASEALAYTYHHLFDMDILIPRYFTVIGEAGRPDMMLLKFIHRIANGKEIEIYGDGEQKRSYTYIKDVVDATLRMIRLIDEKPLYTIINIGNDQSVRLNIMIDWIEWCMNMKAKRVYIDRVAGDVLDTEASIALAKRKLGWTPEIDAEQAVYNTVHWYEENQEWLERALCSVGKS